MSIETTGTQSEQEGWGAWAAAGADLKADLSGLEENDEEGTEDEAKEAKDPVVETAKLVVNKPETETKQNTDNTAELQARLKALEEQVAIATKPPTETQTEKPPEAPKTAVPAEQLEALKDEFPELFKAFLAQNQAIETLGKTVGDLNQREALRQQQEAELVRQAVQADIDKIPALKHWQTKSPEVFQEGINLDEVIRQSQPALTRAERFAKVSAMLEALHGNPLETGQPDKAVVETGKESGKTVKAAVKHAAITLGDLPGGEAGETETSLENAGVAELYAAMWGKSREEQEKVFKRIQ